MCVVPQHLEEGQEIVLEKPELELALGQPVMFPLYTSTVRGDDKAGDVLTVAPEQLLQLPPLHTVLRGGKRSGAKHVPVTLAARSTAIGTLELCCVAKEGGNRWRLEFNVRDLVKEPPPKREASRERQRRRPRVTDVWPEAQVQEAARLIREVYSGDDGPTTPQELTKALEAALDAPRHEWPTGLCRRLWEFLAEVADERRRSPAHLSALVQPGRLLPASRLRRSAGQVPHRAAVEDDGRPAARDAGEPARACRRAAPTTGSCGGAWPAACNPTLQQIAVRPAAAGAAARQGQGRRQAERERAGRDVAGRGQPGAARREARRRRWATRC